MIDKPDVIKCEELCAELTFMANRIEDRDAYWLKHNAASDKIREACKTIFELVELLHNYGVYEDVD